jgi:hypothetical protein
MKNIFWLPVVWFLNLFRPRERYDLYTPGQRLIYSFHDGSKVVRADPLELYRKLMAVGPELNVDMKVSVSPSKDAPRAHENVVKKVREVFGVKPLEEGGLTELEAIQLLDHFLTFCGFVKKNSSQPPTSSTATEEPSPSSPGSPPTSPSSGSGCAAAGPSSAGPTPSPSGPGSPSASLTPDSNTSGATPTATGRPCS